MRQHRCPRLFGTLLELAKELEQRFPPIKSTESDHQKAVMFFDTDGWFSTECSKETETLTVKGIMHSQSSEGIVVDDGEVVSRMLTVLKHHGDHPELVVSLEQVDAHWHHHCIPANDRRELHSHSRWHQVRHQEAHGSECRQAVP
jgi:hypothetical protein